MNWFRIIKERNRNWLRINSERKGERKAVYNSFVTYLCLAFSICRRTRRLGRVSCLRSLVLLFSDAMEIPEVRVHVLLVHLDFADATADAFSRVPFFGDHKGSVKFLDCMFLAVL